MRMSHCCSLAVGVPGAGLAPSCRHPAGLAPPTAAEVGKAIHLSMTEVTKTVWNRTTHIQTPLCSGLSGLEVSEVTLGEVDRATNFQDYQEYQDYLYAF